MKNILRWQLEILTIPVDWLNRNRVEMNRVQPAHGSEYLEDV